MFFKIVFVNSISLRIVGQVINVVRLVLDKFQKNRLNDILDVSKYSSYEFYLLNISKNIWIVMKNIIKIRFLFFADETVLFINHHY